MGAFLFSLLRPRRSLSIRAPAIVFAANRLVASSTGTFLHHSSVTSYHHQQQRLHHVSLCSRKVHTPWSLFMMFNLTSVRAMLTLVFMFMLFNLTSMRAMLTLLFMFMMFNLTSIQAMFILVSEIAMIYVLVLIWKLSTFSTIMPNLFECYYSKSFLPCCVLCIRHSTFRVQIICLIFCQVRGHNFRSLFFLK
jgi:hypothetical protein